MLFVFNAEHLVTISINALSNKQLENSAIDVGNLGIGAKSARLFKKVQKKF
jgi:hypothetical protein